MPAAKPCDYCGGAKQRPHAAKISINRKGRRWRICHGCRHKAAPWALDYMMRTGQNKATDNWPVIARALAQREEENP